MRHHPTDAERLAEAIEIIEGLLQQHCGWVAGTIGGLHHDFLSANEAAFEFLGWEDGGHPMPGMRCDEPGCMKQIVTGWKSPTGYRRTCSDHSDWKKKEVS